MRFKRPRSGSLTELVMLHQPILRLMKTTRNFAGFELLKRALMMSLRAIMVPLFMLLLMVLVFSSFIYWLEPRSNIPSMPGAIWFIVITLSTVGYGDVVP